MSAADEQEWKSNIQLQLRARNRKEAQFKEIITQTNRLQDHIAQLKNDKLKLSIENEQMRTALLATGAVAAVDAAVAAGKSTVTAQLGTVVLEKKLLMQQEELTALYKRKGENSQLILDLNLKVEQQQALIVEKDNKITAQTSVNNSLRAEVYMLKTNIEQLTQLHTGILDEHRVLQLRFNALENKLRNVQDENCSLVERFMNYKSKDAELMNDDNENFLRKRSEKLKRDLEDALREECAITTAIACSSENGSSTDL